MKYIDRFLNAITMYRLVVYGLLAMVACALPLTITGRLPFGPVALLGSIAILLVSHFVADYIFGKLWHVPRNAESWLITGLILGLIIPPASSLSDVLFLVAAGILASASKFLLTRNGSHVFNPAAFAAAILTLTATLPASWWVGNSALWPIVLLIGLAIVRKIRHASLVLTFFIVSLGLQALLFAIAGKPVLDGLINAFTASPLIFLATIMLTEPATMPPRKNEQLVFGAGVAVLYTTALSIGPLVIYPEVALLLGNLYVLAITSRRSVALRLTDVMNISDRVTHYTFTPDQPLRYLPGQYMEWTLPGVPFDSRGNRRTFTIASSPTESTIQVGIKYYEPSSAYKTTLRALQPGAIIHASQLAGSFTMHGHETEKLAFIAGGIGVTPFRSMIKYVVNTKQPHDIVLLYVVSKAEELAYSDVFSEAAAYGVKLIPIVTDTTDTTPGVVHASLTTDVLSQVIPDLNNRRIYISGPNAMVDATREHLRTLGVPRHMITTDHFSGY